MGNNKQTKQIFTTLALTEPEVKEWIDQIIKLNWSKNKKKNRKLPPLVVGLWAERDIEYISWKYGLHPKRDAKSKELHSLKVIDYIAVIMITIYDCSSVV